MSFETWLAFSAASFVMLAIPGPTILLVVSYALAHGRAVASATVIGVALGDLTAMTASLLGLGALLATSATLFTVLKWIGAMYLIWLGIKVWRTPVADEAPQEMADGSPSPARAPMLRIALHAYAVTALNPKSIVFFIAFLPMFIDPARPLLQQAAILEATFVILAALNAAAYGLMASMVRSRIRRPSVRRWINRTGGTLMIGAGLLALGWRRAAN
ncbi:LysE family translocator [Stappia sp. 28M-7]|uniref:LysE family translocator n=1 Tax=Stappia sp. 28M-7 TaxID=2762596 RepID=UPI00163C301A|nr:LysE family translocator [Stappia sp. 28M-7]MBC2859886.1 LysE family translocator [Stappia sp. 28M-7]